jgi:iron complex outermembrane receptor protein
VITRTAADTRGTLATVSAGDREQAAAARYGRKLGEAIDFRVYAKAFKTDAATEPRAGASTTFERQQAGFRSDWKGSGDRFTLQGDLYQGQSSARQLAEGVDLSGANLLGRWTREHADGSSTQLRTYLDQTVHRDPLLLDENGTLFDVDLRHQRDAGPHRWVLGGGYRHAQDDSDAGTRFAFIPARRSLNWANVYAQDQIALTSRWDLTLGTRFERNDYTGWEVLPNARLGWKATPTHFLWTAISRAVRAPSRIEREIVTPPTPPFLVTGSPDFQSEIAKVFELGMRGQPMRSLSYSATLFRQRYDSLKSAELAPTVFPITTGNKIAGTIDGLEAWAAWQATPAWRLIAGGTHLHKSLHNETGSSDPVGPANLGNDPDTHWIARSVWNLRPAHELDVTLRHSSSRAPLPPTNTDPIPAYTGLDMRYAWSVTEAFELALIGTNLLDPSHREWGDRTVSSEIARSVFLRATWKM